MRHAVVEAALTLAWVAVSQAAVADTPTLAPVALSVGGAALDPAGAYRALLTTPELIGSRISGGSASAKGGEVTYTTAPSGATLAWALGGQPKSALVAVGRTSTFTYPNAIGQLVMPPVGSGAPTAPIAVRFYASSVASNGSANNTQVNALPTGRNLDTGRVRATFASINSSITSVMAIDSAAGSASIAVTGNVSPTPTSVSGGEVTYFGNDGAPLMTLKLGGGAVTKVIPPMPPMTTFTIISFQTSVSL